jgi:transposase-like protein
VIETALMKSLAVSPRRRARRTDAAQRAQVLAAFERSGLSASAFARQQGLHYTTFCGWRQRQAEAGPSPAGFVQVQLVEPEAVGELVIELGAAARLRLTRLAQLPLAARLLQALNAPSPC